jgi:outer membrane protein assembly factor BamB
VFRGNAQATGVARDGLPADLELLWTFATAKGGFESTAAVVDGVVYAGSTNGSVYAVDLAKGKQRWQFPTSSRFTASAAVRGGRVYIGDNDGTFYCLDATSGKKLWEFATDGEIDSSANFHGEHVLFGSQDALLYCLDTSGKLVWKCPAGDQIRCTPTVLDDTGFVAGCDAHLHAVDLNRGKDVRQVSLEAPTGSAPAVAGNMVFVGTEGGSFLAIDWRAGKVLWHHDDKGGGAFRSSAAVTPDAVVVGSRDERLHAFDPKTGGTLWSFPTKGRIDSSPVVVGDRVFVGSADGRIYGVSLKTGAKLWQFEAGGAVTASPAVAAGRLVIGSDSGQLYCFGAKPRE